MYFLLLSYALLISLYPPTVADKIVSPSRDPVWEIQTYSVLICNSASNVSQIQIHNRARSTVKAEEAKAASEAGIESDSAPTAEEDRQGR